MRIPGFTADMSLYTRTERYGSEPKPARRNNITNSQVVPAQAQREPCLWIQGNCTPPSGGTSIATNHGFRQVCRGPSQVAWVEICRWPSGTGPITSVDRGCEPCGGGAGGAGGGGTGGAGGGGGGVTDPCAPGTSCGGGCCP